jgi:hypothetical protein
MKPKGRPKQEERIADLERKLHALHEAMQNLNTRTTILENIRTPDTSEDSYQPLFDRWPNGRP